MVHIFRDLGSLKSKVTHSGNYRGNEDPREKPIRASALMRVKTAQSTMASSSVMSGLAMQVCVHGWNTGVDLSS